MYLYPNWPQEMETVEPYRKLDAVVITDEGWKTHGTMLLHLREHPKTFILKPKSIEALPKAVQDCKEAFFLYIEKDNKIEENIKWIADATDATLQEIYNKNGHFKMYQCTFN